MTTQVRSAPNFKPNTLSQHKMSWIRCLKDRMSEMGQIIKISHQTYIKSLAAHITLLGINNPRNIDNQDARQTPQQNLQSVDQQNVHEPSQPTSEEQLSTPTLTGLEERKTHRIVFNNLRHKIRPGEFYSYLRDYIETMYPGHIRYQTNPHQPHSVILVFPGYRAETEMANNHPRWTRSGNTSGKKKKNLGKAISLVTRLLIHGKNLCINKFPKELNILDIENKFVQMGKETEELHREPPSGKHTSNLVKFKVKDHQLKSTIIDKPITIGANTYTIRRYINKKVSRCTKCQKLGHLRPDCQKEKQTCVICAEEDCEPRKCNMRKYVNC